MTDPSLQALADSILREACSRFPIGFAPKIIWKPLRVTAGIAYFKHGQIALSTLVLTDADRLRVTLLHEYAHLLAFARHGAKGKGHNAYWRQAMRDLGLEPEVRHRYEVQRNKPRQEVAYCCVKCGAKLLRKRRLPRKRTYVHARCGGNLRLDYVRPATQMKAAS